MAYRGEGVADGENPTKMLEIENRIFSVIKVNNGIFMAMYITHSYIPNDVLVERGVMLPVEGVGGQAWRGLYKMQRRRIYMRQCYGGKTYTNIFLYD
jgi:hypothetical protein